MALIKISTNVLEDEEIMIPFFYWLDQECCAIVKEINHNDSGKTYHIEGIDIPDGAIPCDAICETIAPNVLIFSIKEGLF